MSAMVEAGARDAVIRDVLLGLYEGRFEPGERLHESRLSIVNGTSRGPIREALNRLAAMGIVELIPQRGARIKLLSAAEALDTLIVAQALVALTARLAALNIESPGARKRLEEVGRRLESFAPSDSGAAFARARDEFYGALSEIAANSQLKATLPTVRVHLIRIQFRAVLRVTDATRLADYRRINQAILAGRPKAAEAAARVHFNRAIVALREL